MLAFNVQLHTTFGNLGKTKRTYWLHIFMFLITVFIKSRGSRIYLKQNQNILYIILIHSKKKCAVYLLSFLDNSSGVRELGFLDLSTQILSRQLKSTWIKSTQIKSTQIKSSWIKSTQINTKIYVPVPHYYYCLIQTYNI